MKRRVSALALGALMMLVALPTANAQDPVQPMTITFVRPGPEYHGVEAFIGTTLCASVDFDESLALEVGGPAAPAQCNEPWRVIELVSLVEDHRHTLFVTPTFEPGANLTIQNFAPPPAVDGPDVHFGVEVYKGTLPSSAQALGSLSAYVGGVLCGSSTLANADAESVWISVSPPDAPTECREEGAAVTLVAENGRVLRVSPTVGVGPFYALTDFTTYPTGEGPAAPVPAEAGHGTTADPPSVVLVLGLIALALAILGMARQGTSATPKG